MKKAKTIEFEGFRETILPVFLPYLETTERINVFYGGAGSGKSKFVVQKLCYKLLKEVRKCLVIRKVSSTIKDSVFAEFKAHLGDMGIYSFCKVNRSELNIELPNGSILIFKGLDDPEKIKSIQGIDDIIIEEATEITLNDFTQLNLRLRSKRENQQIHLMFNPVSKVNWVFKTFFVENYPDSLIVKTTYKDNKFLPESYIKSIEGLKENNYPMWEIYANGKFCSLDKRIFTNWKIFDFELEAVKLQEVQPISEKLGVNILDFRNPWDNPLFKTHLKRSSYFGLDFGYANDPTAFIAFLVDEKQRELWIYDEFYHHGLLNREIADLIRYKGYHGERITCDSAEPKSIKELREYGLRTRSAEKGKDSIINGIQFLQSFRVYIHPSCTNTIMEFENYTWQKDKRSGEYINRPIDKYNHLIDALRYGSEGIRKRRLRETGNNKF